MPLVGTSGPDNLENPGPGSDLVQGLAGDDTLTSKAGHVDTLDGGQGDDLIQYGISSYAEASGAVHVSVTQTGPQDVGADQGVDTLVGVGGVIGGAYNDTLLAGPSDYPGGAWMHGGDGDDSILGGAGNDHIWGDAGNDTIDASTSGPNAAIDGGAGNDVIYLNPHGQSVDSWGGQGDDALYNVSFGHGGDGADTLVGAGASFPAGNGAILNGDAGDDSLVGTTLTDQLSGGSEHNTIDGGGGRDTILIFDYPSDATYRNDVVHEAGSGNLLSFANDPYNSQATVDMGAGTAHVDVVSGSSLQRVADVTFDHIDNLMGSPGADSIVGSAGDDVIYGEAGANTLFGGDGNDRVEGGADHNQINGNKGDDTILGNSTVGDWLLGGQGNDLISAGNSTGHNIINGNLGNDTLSGGFNDSYTGGGGDTLRGGQGDDLITGGSAGDWISGDLGNNTLTGGQGADTFHASAGHDLITDFSTAGGDVVEVDHGVSYQTSQVGGDVHVDLSNGGSLVLQNTQLTSLPGGWIVTL